MAGTAVVVGQLMATDIECVDLSDIKLEAGIFEKCTNELVERTITDSAPAKQIVNKEYVDGAFLLRHGDTVDDLTNPISYTWNQGVTFEAESGNVVPSST